MRGSRSCPLTFPASDAYNRFGSFTALQRVTCIDTFFKRLPDALPDLLELSLEGYGPSNPAPSVLKDLARELPQLRLFKFKDDNDCGFSIGHDDIRDLLWSWKDMERLSIQTVAGARPWLKAPIIVGVRCPRLEYLQLELRCSAGCKCLHANYHFDATASDHDAARVDYLPETLRRPTEYDALEAMNENDEQVTPYVHEQWRVCDSVIMRAGEVSQEAQQNAFARLIIIELPSKGRLRSKGRSDKDPYSMTTIFNHSKVEADLREKLLAAC